MALGKKRRSKAEADVDIDMVPVMNMFLVLIPFLLISANFINLRVINAAVPVLSQAAEESKPSKKVEKVTVVVELEDEGLKFSALSESVTVKDLKVIEAYFKNDDPGNYPLTQVAAHLKSVKKKYPLSDTLIIIPGGEVLYDAIIQLMDVSRFAGKEPLFPNMVLSGKA